jgi:hypothetical protein
MNKTGWNYYSALDVRYDKQLVAVRRDSASLFKSFVLKPEQFQMNTTVDSNAINTDSIITAVNANTKDSSKSLFTSGTLKSTQKPESVLQSEPLKSQKNQNLNALKNQFPTPVKKAAKPVLTKKSPSQTDEEKVLSEVKTQPVKKEPKAVMKKKQADKQ